LTKQPVADFAVRVTTREPYVYEMKKTAEAGRCLFLKENRCTIYAERPLICRFYPFGVETNQNIEVFYSTDECPGIGNGKLMRKRDFKKLKDLAETRAR
jgi:Fe-S-cluster containining protein